MEASTKRTVILGIVFSILSILLIAVPFLVFPRPNHHDERKWGVVHVHLSDNFSQYHQAQAAEAMQELSRLGPTFVLGGEGANYIEVLSTDLTSGRPGDCSAKGAARYELTKRGESRIVIDPTCTQGSLEFRTALMHEVGHALGMQHICLPGEDRRDCSPVGRGFAVMNPNLVNEVGESDTAIESTDTGPVPTFQIQDLDAREFQRVTRPGDRLIKPLTATLDGGF